jgi:hypothetical protein
MRWWRPGHYIDDFGLCAHAVGSGVSPCARRTESRCNTSRGKSVSNESCDCLTRFDSPMASNQRAMPGIRPRGEQTRGRANKPRKKKKKNPTCLCPVERHESSMVYVFHLNGFRGPPHARLFRWWMNTTQRHGYRALPKSIKTPKMRSKSETETQLSHGRSRRVCGRGGPGLVLNELQELFPRLCGGAHTTQHAAGDCLRRSFLDAAHYHAQVAALHDNSDTLRLQHFCECQSHLFGKPLLYLQSPRKHLCYSSQLREADDAAIRDITDVHLPHVRSLP